MTGSPRVRDPAPYMRGGCYALALFLAARTDCRLYGCLDEAGVLHHAFVYDEVAGLAYDGRGAVALAEIGRYRGRALPGTRTGPVDREVVLRYAALMEPFTDARIRRFVAGGGFPALSRRPRPDASGAEES